MELQCQFRNLGRGYTCVVEEAFITEPKVEIQAIIGDHLPGKSNKDVEDVRFALTTVHYFPRRLDKFFPRLRSLFIGQCGLKVITRKDLSGLENLKELTVINNELRSLPSNLFVGMRKLKRVSFAYNKLEYLSSQMLVPLLGNEITVFDLINNPSIHAGLDFDGNKYTLEGLMDSIDKRCKKPMEDDDDDDDINTLVAKSNTFADFTILAGKGKNFKEFKVHKSVLESQSTVFEAIFKKQDEEMKIKDFNPKVVGELLRFMYTGEMPEMVNATNLFKLAAKFEVDSLKIQCKGIVLSNITHYNAMEVFRLGFHYNEEDLKEAAFEKIKKMFPKLDESLKDKPDMLGKLFNAQTTMKRKVKEATIEYEKVLKMCKNQE